jgi:Recombinase
VRQARSEEATYDIDFCTWMQAQAALAWLQAMQAEGLSLQAMANRLNNEGVPTLSGKGSWKKGTIANLLAEKG